MPVYSVYGTALESDFAFAAPLPVVERRPDLSFECVAVRSGDVPPFEEGEVVYTQGERPDGEADFAFSRFTDHAAIRITDGADFHLWTDRIVCILPDARHHYLVEIALFGLVMALWLEHRGTPTLHASSAVLDGRAIAFLGPRGQGKTTLAAACVAAGHALLTDDLLAIDVTAGDAYGRPGYPMMRLWPEQAARLLGSGWQDLPTVRPDSEKRRVPVGSSGLGRFHDRSAPLARLLIPERTDDPAAPVTMTPLRPRDGVLAALRYSFLPSEVARYDLQAARLPRLVELVSAAEVFTLRYPAGVDRLPEVVERLAELLTRS